MFCKYCGQLIDDDSLFCASCGKHVSSSLPNNKLNIHQNEIDRISVLAHWEDISSDQIEPCFSIIQSNEIRMIHCYKDLKLFRVCGDDSISRKYWIESNGVRVSPYFDDVEYECYQNQIVAENNGKYSLYEVVIDKSDKYTLIEVRNLPTPYNVESTSGIWFHVDNLFEALNLSSSLKVNEKDLLKLGEYNYAYYGEKLIFSENGIRFKWKVERYHLKDFIESAGQCLLLGIGSLLGSFLTDWWHWISIAILSISPIWGLWAMLSNPSSRLVIKEKKYKR